MSFLAPLFLLGALAIAAPVLFHLIRQTTRERTLFSSIMFLPPTRPRATKRSRLEHLLLLFLRCLALALLTLGFARPFLRKSAPTGGAPAEARRLVVLVDVSASMRRTDLWAGARERAAAILRTAAPGDEAAVFTFARRTTTLVSFEEWKATPASGRVALALGRLAAAAPGWEEDRLGDALIRASEALTETDGEKKSPGPRQIFLISDLKAGSRLESLQAYDWPKNIELRTERVPARYPTNAGLQLVADAPDADRQASPAVRVRVSNAADSTREQFRVGWAARPRSLNASEAAANPAPGREDSAYLGPAVDVYVPPGHSRVVAVPLLARAADMRQITLQGDDEDFDNTVYVAPSEVQRWSVLYFGADAADGGHGPLFFLRRALPHNPHLAVTVAPLAPSARVAPAQMAEAKLFFVMDSLAPETAAALRGQMVAGKTVLFAPASAEAGATLARLLAVPGLTLEDAQPSDYAMFDDIDFHHPLFAPFADPHFSDFTKIHIWKYRRLALDRLPAARVLAKFDSGDPALVEIPVGRGRLLALLTGWNPEDSQLAVSSKFVPLIYSLLDLAGGPSDEASQYFVGDSIPLPATGGAAEAATILRPDGTTEMLPAGATAWADALQPGIYQLSRGGRTRRVAVNVPASESRTEPLPADELERYGAPGPHPAPDAARVAQQEALLAGAEAESRQKLWRWLLGGTLAVLLLESAVAGWTSRRNGPPVATGGAPS